MDQVGYLLFGLNILLGGFMYLLKNAHVELKEKQQHLEARQDSAARDISKIREEYIKREDFKEFKEELWRKLDKLEFDLKERIPRVNDE